jgi:Helix-turn-helix domain
MKKFLDVLGRYEGRKLSALEAGEILGCSERQFRRWRDRYEEEGLEGLVDRRLGKASAKRVPGGPSGMDTGAIPHALPGLEREAFPRASGEVARVLVELHLDQDAASSFGSG